jgi:ribosome-associated protein
VNKELIDITKELQFATSRSGGKGGQNVNKVETKVEARWCITNSVIASNEQKEILLNKLANKINDAQELIVTSSEDRTQLANKLSVIKKINRIVNDALKVEKKRKKTAIPEGVKQARLKEKKVRAEIKEGRKKIDYD